MEIKVIGRTVILPVNPEALRLAGVYFTLQSRATIVEAVDTALCVQLQHMIYDIVYDGNWGS